MISAILAIESSCDETAVAVVSDQGAVLADAIHSQIAIHQVFGGVVPEVASRAHFEILDRLVSQVLEKISSADVAIRSVAATKGPGLVGPLIVGACYAEGLAQGWRVPCIGVHHLRGHLASVLLGATDAKTLSQRAHAVFPALVLLVSGGHTQVLKVGADLRAEKWAETADDAAGECFDKSAKLMGLPYPGGPAIEQMAADLGEGDRARANQLLKILPRPRSSEGFSFAGLKTAIRIQLERDPTLKIERRICMGGAESIAESLTLGLDRAIANRDLSSVRHLIFCGGVSANLRLRQHLTDWADRNGLELCLAPMKYCTDNAAMIGAAAWVQAADLAVGEISSRLEIAL